MTPEKPLSEALAPAAQLLMSVAARDDKDATLPPPLNRTHVRFPAS